jgi:glycosyltransferase involved in cell wall biosynthesis
MRILFLGYGHTSFAPGGAQQIGAEMLRAARARGHVAEMVVGLDPPEALRFVGTKSAIVAAPDERGLSYFVPRDYDGRLISCVDWRATGDLREFIRRYRPDVVHFQHYHRLGVEAFIAARLAAPEATISLTFHEMMAMCPANGQMVKIPSREICKAASPEACAQCVPDRGVEYYALRADRIRAALEYCDGFVFPSRYLQDLYVRWGLPASKSAIVPNGLSHPAAGSERSRPSPNVNRFAYFGQLIDTKGVDVVLRALLHLVRLGRIPASGLEFHIHGANRRYATPAYLDELEDLANEVVNASGGRINIVDRGEYRRDEVAKRMAETDWVLVPSVWPENDPLVVWEARLFGRPVIGSAAGGLAERIRHGVDGLTFGLGDAQALAERIAAICGDAATWERFSAAAVLPATDHELVAAYERLWSYWKR